MIKLDCTCGQHITMYADEATTADFQEWWESEYAEHQAAYRAALALVDWLEPEPEQDRSWKVGGRWYHGLGDVLGALQDG